MCGCRNKNEKCSEGCSNQPLPEEESDELVMVAMEEQIATEDLHEMEESEFADFVFAAQRDSDSD